MVFAQGLGELTELQHLNLDDCYIGFWDDVDTRPTHEFGLAFSKLKRLRTLSLNGNPIFETGHTVTDGTMALIQGIGDMTELQTLRLEATALAKTDDVNVIGTIALSETLVKLKKLVHLDLSSNFIGHSDDVNAAGTIALGNALKSLPNLKVLNRYLNSIGFKDDENPDGTRAIGMGISHLIALTSLNLGSNRLGSSVSPQGKLEIGRAIKKLAHLRHLDLSQNELGRHYTMGEVEIFGSLTNLHNLCSLDMHSNLIGSTGPEATTMLLTAVSRPRRKFLSFDISPIQNVRWNENAQAMSRIESQALQDQCESRVCFGEDESSSSKSHSAQLSTCLREAFGPWP